MKRLVRIAAVVVPLLSFAVAHTYADVKTRTQSSIKFEGALGKVINFFSRGKDTAITSTEAVKGNRKATMNESNGQIVDLSEEKVYDLNVKKKEYTVKTFDEIRKEMRDAQERAKKEAEKEQPTEKGEPQKPQKEYEIDVDVKDTGQKKQLIGYDTHETIVTVTVREKGKTLEDSGGVVLTSDLWLGPRIPELKELTDFDVRYWKALQEGSGIATMSPEQAAQVMAMFPLFGKAMERMQKDGDKLAGTPPRHDDDARSGEEQGADDAVAAFEQHQRRRYRRHAGEENDEEEQRRGLAALGRLHFPSHDAGSLEVRGRDGPGDSGRFQREEVGLLPALGLHERRHHLSLFVATEAIRGVEIGVAEIAADDVRAGDHLQQLRQLVAAQRARRLEDGAQRVVADTGFPHHCLEDAAAVVAAVDAVDRGEERGADVALDAVLAQHFLQELRCVIAAAQ